MESLMQVGKATASDVWRGLFFVLSHTQLQICLVLPCSNPNSAYLHMQAADYPGSRHFIKERLKSRDHHMLKNEGKCGECSSQLPRPGSEAEPRQAPSPGGLSGSESSKALQEHAGTSEGEPRSRMQHTQLHKSFFFTDIRHQEFEDNFPSVLLGFFHLPTRHHWTLLNGVYKANPESSLDNITRNYSSCHLTVHRCKAIHAAIEVTIYIFLFIR